MRNLKIYIEIKGKSVYVGNIAGNGVNDACFTYANEYFENERSKAISISLPLNKKTFSPEETKSFFEGLLPEGFTRRCVAQWMRADENDYLAILSGLGQECLGAIRIVDENNTPVAPEYRKLSEQEVHKLAKEGATESAELVTKAHLSLTGASGKVGLYYDNGKWYLPIGDAPSTHIVKQSHVRLQRIVNNELLCVHTAKKMGIDVPDSFIISLGSYEDSEVLFATKRYDRKINEENRKLNNLDVPYRLHQEDFSQALGISAIDKYEKNNAGYMKKMFDLLGRYSANPIADQMKLWEICIFNYLVGNTDNHIKNSSLLYSEDLQAIRLAPAYDMVSTIIYDSSSEDMAMGIGGTYRIYDITRDSFEKEAKNIGLGSKLAMNKFDEMVEYFPVAIDKAAGELTKHGLRGIDEICATITENYKKRIIM